jgi:hypothetical protein
MDVGMDNPPLFVLTDQNFPSMVPAEGEGECLKIIQVENGSLADLVEVFLGVTRGFDVPAGAVVLIASASHAAAVGTADYASDFVRASGSLRGAFAGAVTVQHGVPFLLGGIENTAALRAIAEIEQWIKSTSGNDTISATRAIFKDSITAGTECTDQHTLIRLPITQTSTEKCTFESMGFGNLKTVVDPITEDFERYLLGSLIDELNSLYPLSLATEFVCDRFLEDEVFSETMNPTALVLIGASHLRNMVRLLDTPGWQVFDLTTPGWKITELSVRQKTAEIVSLGKSVDLEKATVILQLYDNSVFMVGGAGGTKSLPTRDSAGRYHICGELLVADKAGIKDLTSKLVPLIRALNGARKVFLSPLSRYWLDPCCPDPDHLTNYRKAGYLQSLGSATNVLKEYIRDSLYTRHSSNFRVLCPNKILGIGQRRGEMPIEDAREIASLWGSDPVHPAGAAYQVIADGLIQDISNTEARFTNPPKTVFKNQVAKKPRLDLSLERDAWVSGCTAALPRRDSALSSGRGYANPRGNSVRGHWKRGQPKSGSTHPRGGWGRGRGRGRGH